MFDIPILTTRLLTAMLASAIAPVTLISGITFLTSVMANRYGRCIDRIRGLLKEIQTVPNPSPKRDALVTQINILYSRTRALRTTMSTAGASIFCVVLTVAGTFANLLTHFPSAPVIAGIFLIALSLLVVAVTGFVHDLIVSLNAVQVEIKVGLAEQIETAPEKHVAFDPDLNT